MKNEKQTIACVQYYDSPCGRIILASVDNELCLCDWYDKPCAERNKCRLARLMNVEYREEPSGVLQQTVRQLDEYFAGHRKTFNIPLHTVGTEFQKRVWEALQEIPYGETKSYKDIAVRIDNVKGVRAVAQAVGANGISIIIPCHRVIGTNHTLTGFAGGLEAKKILLEIERRNSSSDVMLRF